MRRSASISIATLLSGAAFAQSATTKPAFDTADVHVSPRGNWVKTPANAMQGGFLNAGRYELRRATMLDLIRTAYGLDADKVYGGPSWLDYDRFEVIAKAPPATRPETVKLMLQSLLADRFKLVVHEATQPLPAYVLSMGKGKPKLKSADGDGAGCRRRPLTINDVDDPVPSSGIQCRNITMEAFAPALRTLAGNFLSNLPVMNSTGLEGAWDFDLNWPIFPASPDAPVGANLIEAIEKQLGLKLELQKLPQPVLVVDSVNEQPAANPPDVAAGLPPPPPLEFEVASIRPCEGIKDTLPEMPRFQAGGRVTATCAALSTMIRQAWGVDTLEELVGAPKWLVPDGHIFNIVAKAPSGVFTDAQLNSQDVDALNAMLRTLLMDRFKMAIHYEDRPMDAYTLVAVRPKLTKADPSNRTACTRQSPQVMTTSSAVRTTCRNITMAQFAEQLQELDSIDIHYPVLDATGIVGAWDFTITYNFLINIGALPMVAAARAAAGVAPGDAASDPTGGISFIDAVEKQLGLKLEKHKRPVRVLVIDHIEENPSEN
jgi:uncharacterized protein (TIGR03435 family)